MSGIDKKRLHPEDKGRLVTAFLESFFSRYVEYDFTAALEEQLDRISNGELDWQEVLRAFWQDFSAAVGGTKDLRVARGARRARRDAGPAHLPATRATASIRARCPTCGDGRLSLKLGKFGAFIGCSNYPECKYTRQLSPCRAMATADGEGGTADAQVLGEDPETGLDVTVRDGPLRPLRPARRAARSPSAPAFPRAWTRRRDRPRRPRCALLSLPREVATHPESGEPILAGIGRFGPYVQHGKTYANLGTDDDVLAIGANRAIDLIVAKETRRRAAAAPRRRRPGARRASGPGGPVTVRAGRYGPYVKHGKVNATLPKGMPPDA